jgi:hypothetical protein
LAYLPCAVGNHPFPGKSGTLYPAVSYLGDMHRWKLRLCPRHATIVEELLEPCEITDTSPPLAEQDSFPCLTCGGPTLADDRHMLFATSYFPKQERRDYWAMIHNSCPTPPLLQEPTEDGPPEPVGTLRGLPGPTG